MKILKYSEEIGWYGMLAVLIGYFLLSFGFISNKNLIYIILNFTGSLGLFYISYKKNVKSLSLFYLLWAIISLI